MPLEDRFGRLAADNILGPVNVSQWFSNPCRPLEVDLGCGAGRHLIARAAKHPDVNLLGIDRLLGRLRKAARAAEAAGADNVRLLRLDIVYAATHLLPPDSVRAYHVLFPDPWPKARHQRHRLFSTEFLNALVRTLEPGGTVRVATDHLPYFACIARLFADDPRFAPAPVELPGEAERSDFELEFLGARPVARLAFRKVAGAVDPARLWR